MPPPHGFPPLRGGTPSPPHTGFLQGVAPLPTPPRTGLLRGRPLPSAASPTYWVPPRGWGWQALGLLLPSLHHLGALPPLLQRSLVSGGVPGGGQQNVSAVGKAALSSPAFLRSLLELHTKACHSRRPPSEVRHQGTPRPPGQRLAPLSLSGPPGRDQPGPGQPLPPEAPGPFPGGPSWGHQLQSQGLRHYGSVRGRRGTPESRQEPEPRLCHPAPAAGLLAVHNPLHHKPRMMPGACCLRGAGHCAQEVPS